MTTLTLNVHLPFLRSKEPNIPFLGGTLWTMPFETFNGLTSGAFEDHQASYEQTKPVFFNYELNADDVPSANQSDEPSSSVMELKVPTNEQNYNDEIINTYPFNIFKYIQDKIMDSVWETLILGIPTGQFVQPRHSISFINSDNDVKYFNINDTYLTSKVNFRGDADLEYILMPEASGREIDVSSLKEAEKFYRTLPVIHNNDDLSMALTSMKTSNLPYITEDEKLTICSSALENLVIPNVDTDIRKTFAHRIAAILSESAGEYNRISELSRELYGIRNQAIHGKGTKTSSFSPSYEAQLLLSQIIKTLAVKAGKGEKLSEILQEADKKPSQASKGKIGIQPSEIINDSSFKLLREKVSTTVTIIPGTNNATDNERNVLYWSPLLGMATDINFVIPNSSALFTFLNTNELISLEDKDIRRDFIAKFNTSDRLTASLCLSCNLHQNDSVFIGAKDGILTEFERVRNLLVIVLRLAGFKKFIDPELLGNYMYRGSMRYRQASILRLSVLMVLGKEPLEVLQNADNEPLLKYWDLLALYHSNTHSAEIDLILNIYRRIHENWYMPVKSRASLSFTLLEKLLGTFRAKNEDIQLEDLITAELGKNEITDHFRRKGRATRNSVAHGYWNPVEGEADFHNVLQVLDNITIVPGYLYQKSR